MSLPTLILLLMVEQGNLKYLDNREDDLKKLADRGLIYQDGADWCTTMSTQRKIDAILELL